MSCFEEAKAKLDDYTKVTGQKQKVMATSVAFALIEFCQQSEEFAQAVCQGGSFQECMNDVAKGAGYSISDLDAYKKAVQFYFPGANVLYEMHIMMSEYDIPPEVPGADEAPKNVVINLDEFF